MKLKKLRIQHFRCYEDVEIDFSDFNCIVGKNDSGKSAIFKALEMFFDYKSDAFEYDYNGIIPANSQEIFADDGCPITLTATIECDDELLSPFVENGIEPGCITIRKQYTIESQPPKYRYRFGIIVSELLFGVGGLQSILGKDKKIKNAPFVINSNLNIENKPKLKLEDLGNGRVLIPTELIAPFYLDLLFKPLPKFKMLNSATSIDVYTRLYIETLMAAEMKEFAEKVNAKLSPELKRLFVTNNQFSQSSDNDEVTICEPKISISGEIMTNIGEKNIPLSNRGEGFQLNVRNAIFRHLTLLGDSDNKIIFAFEEPEAHLHPSAQRELKSELKKLSRNPNYQVILTTHSPTIVSQCKRNELIQVKRENGITSIVNGSDDAIRDAIEDLGITENDALFSLFQTAKCILLVEGPDDVMAFEHICNQYKKHNKISKTLSEIGCVIVPAGGCGSIKHWATFDVVGQLCKPFYIVLDSDKKSAGEESKNLIQLREQYPNNPDNYTVWKKREIENYIPCSYFRTLTPPISISYNDWDDVKSICENHRAKDRLGLRNVCRTHFSHLTYEQLRSTLCPNGKDSEDEFLAIYNKIKKLCK